MKYSWLYRTRTRALLGIMLALSQAACGDGHSPTASEGADAQDLSVVEDSGARNGGDAPAIAPGEPNPGVPVASVEALVTALSETGVNATYQGQSLGTSWFLPAEHLVNINGQDVRIFAYDSVQALEEDADKVSLDGGTIGLVSVRWMAPPRFYARGAFLALYVGVDEEIIRVCAAGAETTIGASVRASTHPRAPERPPSERRGK